jgi:hypothetical protein
VLDAVLDLLVLGLDVVLVLSTVRDPGLALATLGHLVLGLLGVALGLGAVMG